ncbi:MAG: beta-propeller domain-containing protein, partial [Pseudomonadota bacterium]
MRKQLLAALALAAAFAPPASAVPTTPQKTLAAFTSEQELTELFKGWSEAHRRRQEALRESSARAMASPSAPASLAEAAAKSADESVTNVQHAGVDEGGIVKLHGDYLVILRRGRLFSVAVNDRQLRPVSQADAYGAGVDPRGAWYDEMLMWGSTIAVIGYSYARGGTEIGLFELSTTGELKYKSTWHLRSNDYYSSRNYASRLIGSKLVFYTPLYLNPWGGLPAGSFPAFRKWRAGATPAEFRRIAPATRIYRSDEPLDPFRGVALHSVTVCDLAQAEMSCESSAVLGPPGRVFYVSPGSVYVWNVNAGIFRIPLDGSAPSALKANGSPIDQF